MRRVISIKAMQRIAKEFKREGKVISFVPTMGFLHEGHISLIRKAREEGEIVVVSIFVNPTQFGPGEDFKKYPRDLNRDLKIARAEKVDYVFTPRAEEMYGPDFKTQVLVKDLSEKLCGKYRPGHFAGVTLVVLKLFHLVQPDLAYFGQKDAQQAVIIKRMVADLNLPVKIKVLPIVREKDGLALSSRNTYLSSSERMAALVLSRSLEKARELVKQGERRSKVVYQAMREIIRKEKLARLEYLALVDSENLNPVKTIQRGTLIALAVKIGSTRLIDNWLVKKLPPPKPTSRLPH